MRTLGLALAIALPTTLAMRPWWSDARAVIVPALEVLAMSAGLAFAVRWRPGLSAFIAASAVLLVTWAWFFWLDLRHAQFAWFTLVVPLGALAGALVGRGTRLGGAVALSALWTVMVLRSDNGCTGVSDVYDQTLLITGLVLFGGGPWLIDADLRIVERGPAPEQGATTGG